MQQPLANRVASDADPTQIAGAVLAIWEEIDDALTQQYAKLKEIRDSATHFKREDQARHAAQSHEPTALQDLLSADAYSFPETAMAVIQYFFKTGTAPRWLVNPAWIRTAVHT